MIGRSSPSDSETSGLSFLAVNLLARSCDSGDLMGQLFIDILNDVRSFYDDFYEAIDITF